MTNTSTINEHARKIAGLMSQIEDIKIEMKAATEIAEQQGVDPKALRKVAKEMIMDSAKLEKRLEEEAQLSFFRDVVGVHEMKGISKIGSAKTTTEATVAFLQERRKIVGG